MHLLLEVDNIDVSYGEIQVLRDVSIKVNSGENVAILGSNGAGKTTLVHAIMGLIHPTKGVITFQGTRIEKYPPHKIVEHGIALVPEGRQLFTEMTVIENLQLGAFTKRAREKFQDTLEWVYQLFPILKERSKQVAGTLSGGEQQMLAIARALMTRPKLLILDEPSAGLMPLAVRKVFDIVEKLTLERITTIIVEQNVAQSLKIANRGYILENGMVVLEGKANELLQNPHVKKAYLGL